MDPLSSLRASLPPSPLGGIEGSVESVDPKTKSVTVRVAGSETVVARGEGMVAGDRVQIVRDPAGAWVAKPVPRPEIAVATDPLLEGWVAFTSGSTVVRGLKSSDPVQVRAALTALWSEIASTPAEELPADLQDSKARGLPPLAALGARAAATGHGSIAPLALREEIAPGLYRAESAGRPLELSGPAGVRLGEAGLWAESQIGDILSLWVPASVERAVAPELPGRITADAVGARRILDRLGIPVETAEDEDSLKSLVRTLVRAEALLEEASTTRASAPSTTSNPSAVPTGSAGTAAPAPIEPPVVVVARSTSESKVAAPSAPAPPTTGAPRAPDPASIRLLLDPEAVPESSTRVESGVADPGIGTEPPPTAPAGASEDSAPRAVPLEAGARPVVAAASSEAPAPAFPIPAEETVSGKAAPLAAARPPAPASVAPVPAPGLPVGLALRVVKAWAVSEGEPSDAVLRAAIGEFPELPEAIRVLAKALGDRPESFAAVRAFLRESTPESPLLARHLGLETPRSAPAAPSTATSPQGRDFAQSLVEDLGKALQQGRAEDAAVLRDALGSLVAEGFDGARDPANPMGASPWTMPPREGRPDGGRVVVQDRRRARDGSPERTVVDVSMTPTGLGGVDAHLELRGQDLDVGFRVREPATAERIRANLPELRRILSEIGLEPRELDVRQGRGAAKPVPKAGARRDEPGGLDIRA